MYYTSIQKESLRNNVSKIKKEHLIFDKVSSHKRETNRPKQTEKRKLEEGRTWQNVEQD